MRSRRSRLAAAAIAISTLSGACGLSAQGSPHLADDKAVPFRLLSPTAPTILPPANAAHTENVALCFIEGDRLASTERALDAPVELTDVAAALTEPPPEGQSLRSALGPPSPVARVRLVAGVVQVDLASALASLGGNDQLLAIAQLVCTLTARPGVGQVAFTLAGSPVDVPRGDGSLTADPVSRDDYAALLP